MIESGIIFRNCLVVSLFAIVTLKSNSLIEIFIEVSRSGDVFVPIGTGVGMGVSEIGGCVFAWVVSHPICKMQIKMHNNIRMIFFISPKLLPPFHMLA